MRTQAYSTRTEPARGLATHEGQAAKALQYHLSRGVTQPSPTEALPLWSPNACEAVAELADAYFYRLPTCRSRRRAAKSWGSRDRPPVLSAMEQKACTRQRLGVAWSS